MEIIRKPQNRLAHDAVRRWVGGRHHQTRSLRAVWLLVLAQRRVGKKTTGD